MHHINQDASGSAAYRPTSLDFINLPNPIEPHTQAQKHPLNGTPRLEKARLENNTNQDLFKLILEPCNERPTKRQKPVDNTLLDLPKLPVRSAAKRRLRIPPTLSGLHQPPPDAGLLPSISVDQPQVPPPRAQDASASYTSVADRPLATEQPSTTLNESPPSAKPTTPTKPIQSKAQRNKWSECETADLLRGVAQFGIGNWTKILKCEDYQFHHRTALDLKDRFRVCCPEQYNSKKTSKKDQAAIAPTPAINETGSAVPDATISAKSSPKAKKVKGPASERVSTTQLKDLGIDEPFAKSGRRSRHGYSEAEDEAILRGFQKYGKSWSSIRKDVSLNLMNRKPRDLRDRMRTRYPEEYAKAGLALPAEKQPSKRGGASPAETVPDKEATKEADQPPQPPPPVVQEDGPNRDDVFNKPAKRPAQHSIFNLDECFFDDFPSLLDDGYIEENIVLDRGILDWAPRNNENATTTNHTSNGIDPLMTLKLPTPVASSVPLLVVNQDRGPNRMQSMTSQNLPSLATLLPSDLNGDGQLELPGLMHWNNPPLDESGRSGNLTLEELMG